MMEYRKLPRGTEEFSVLGIGLGGAQVASAEEIEAMLRKAFSAGINFVDACCGGAHVYAPLGRAIADRREQIYLELHFGAVYNDRGDYGWSRDLQKIKDTFAWEMEQMGTDYVDFGFLHCIDEEKDLEELLNNGIVDFVKELHAKGIVRRIGFSSHTPRVAQKVLDLGIADIMLFSINVAYDYEKGDEYGVGTASERAELFRRCQKEGIGISVMKPYHGGQLMDAKQSPFGVALTHYQCLQYVLDRPGVLVAVPGICSMQEMDALLGFLEVSDEEKDYAVIGNFSADVVTGNCVYCNHCKPCPAGIDVGLVNKYYDLAKQGDTLAANHYRKLSVDASACLNCGHCDERCPFGVKQSSRMQQIAEYFAD